MVRCFRDGRGPSAARRSRLAVLSASLWWVGAACAGSALLGGCAAGDEATADATAIAGDVSHDIGGVTADGAVADVAPRPDGTDGGPSADTAAPPADLPSDAPGSDAQEDGAAPDDATPLSDADDTADDTADDAADPADLSDGTVASDAGDTADVGSDVSEPPPVSCLTPDAAEPCGACAQPKVEIGVVPSAECETLDPAVCRVGTAPTPADVMTPLPEPAPACCPSTAEFGDWTPTGAPTLGLEVGTMDPESLVFVPYQQRQWAPLVIGPQGMFHVWAGVRFSLPGAPVESVKFTLVARGLDGCNEVMTTTFTLAAYPDPAQPGVYVTPVDVTLLFPYGPLQACRFCGQWLDLRVAIHPAGADAWGEVQRSLRLYLDMNPLELPFGF